MKEKSIIFENKAWRAVPGFEDKYFINLDTKEGLLLSLYSPRRKKAYITNNYVEKSGYIMWRLWKDGKSFRKQAARWIAITFLELVQNEYFEGAVIDHIDTDRLNNHPSNLRWCTQKENINNPTTLKHKQGVLKGKKHTEDFKQHMKEALKGNKNRAIPVSQYSLQGEYIDSYESSAAAERENPDLKISKEKIGECCKGKRKTHAGFIWKYKEAC